MPSRNPVQTPTSPTRTAPKPSYSQMAIQHPPEPTTKPSQWPTTKGNLRPHDPGKSPPRDQACDPPHDLACDSSCDLQALKQARDLPACDCGNLTYDLPRDWSCIWSTVDWESTKSQDLLQNCGTVHSSSIISWCLFLAQVSPISCIITCPKGARVHLSLDIMPTLNYAQTTLY